MTSCTKTLSSRQAKERYTQKCKSLSIRQVGQIVIHNTIRHCCQVLDKSQGHPALVSLYKVLCHQILNPPLSPMYRYLEALFVIG
jgi:hypothetical protein